MLQLSICLWGKKIDNRHFLHLSIYSSISVTKDIITQKKLQCDVWFFWWIFFFFLYFLYKRTLDQLINIKKKKKSCSYFQEENYNLPPPPSFTLWSANRKCRKEWTLTLICPQRESKCEEERKKGGNVHVSAEAHFCREKKHEYRTKKWLK